MKKIRYLQVRFEGHIEGNEVPALRGAIAQKVGNEQDLFHNHSPNGDLYHRYPRIQYKSLYGQPAIVAVEEGVDALNAYFAQGDRSIEIKGKAFPMDIDRITMKQYTLQVWNKEFHYYLHNWIPLGGHAYEEYKSCETLVERLCLLERVLTNHIVALGKGLNWETDKVVKAYITKMLKPQWVKVKDVNLMAFSMEFKSNVFIPEFLGIGKSVSIGYGTVQKSRQTLEKEKNYLKTKTETV